MSADGTSIDVLTLTSRIPQIIEAVKELIVDGTQTQRGFFIFAALIVAGIIIAAIRSNDAETATWKKSLYVLAGVVAVVVMTGWGRALEAAPSLNPDDALVFEDDTYQLPDGRITTKRGYLVHSVGGAWLECAEDPAKGGELQAERFRELGQSSSALFLLRRSLGPQDCGGQGVVLRLDFTHKVISLQCIDKPGFERFYRFTSYKPAGEKAVDVRRKCDHPAGEAFAKAQKPS